VTGPRSCPFTKGLDENLVVKNGVTPNDLRQLVGSSLRSSRERVSSVSDSPSKLFLSEVELDGVSKLMTKDGLDSVLTAPSELRGDHDGDVTLSGVVVPIGAISHVSTLWEL